MLDVTADRICCLIATACLEHQNSNPDWNIARKAHSPASKPMSEIAELSKLMTATITRAKTSALTTIIADQMVAPITDTKKSLRLPPLWRSSRRLVDFTYEANGLLRRERHAQGLRSEMR